MKRVIFKTAVGGLDLGDEDKVKRIVELATMLAGVDTAKGWEMRALLNLAVVLTSGDSQDVAWLLADAGALAGHACGMSLPDVLQHVREGYDLAVATREDVAAIIAAQDLRGRS